MNPKKFISLILVIFTILSLFSCQNNTDGKDGEYYSFTDSTGVRVTLSEKPSRVAVLFSSYADIWVSAGGNVHVTVGDSLERGFSDESALLVDSGAGHTSIDIETLIASDVDLVIGTSDYACQVEACQKMNELGVPSALFKVESFEDYLSVLKILTDITGRADLYEKHGTEVKKRIDEIKSAVSKYISTSNTPDILFLRAGSSAKSTKAKSSSDNFAAAMISELGGKNIADEVPLLLDGLSLEAVIEEDPDFVFITTMGDESAAKSYITELFGKDGWNTLSAVRNEKYYFLPKELFHYKPNSRWGEAYEYIARLLCPDIEL